MNIQEYISTGILEAYILDDLSQTENVEVEKLANEYPEIRDEIARIEETLQIIAEKTKESLPEALKAQILDSTIGPVGLQGDVEKNLGKTSILTQVEPVTSPTKWRYLVAASISLATFASIAAVVFYINWKEVEQERDDLIAQNQRLADNIQQVDRELKHLSNDYNIINKKNFQKIALEGLEISPESLAFIYWNRSTQEVYLNVNSLPIPDRDLQYQLWGIIDGKPVDAGIFEVNLSGLQRMKDIAGASAFAVTLEPKGGSKSPTMDQMYIIGNV
ncbi:MAG: anti-sigma factor [Bacteroidetes bacterium]|nr:anti-sigma factor [Bacteroidota bacterium]